ncbi:MAG: DNA replication/repair protein RecF [Anaerolineales bacterium]|nr:DNA replication/repair protein RecF [Anaerolineales bacterium]
MRIVRLSLANFRNYIRLETAFPRGPILLAGPNAQGKTSLLEAVYLFTHARSPLAENDRQLINFLALREEQPFARLEAEVEDSSGGQRLELRLFFERTAAGERRFRKDILVNSVRRKPSELPGMFRALLFLPQELRVIDGAPGDRRRHLDEAAAQADSSYRAAMWEYHHALTQRNALLRALQEGDGRREQLDVWDEPLAASGAALLLGRARALAEIEVLAAPLHRRLTRGAEALHIRYCPAWDPARPTGESDGAQRELPMDAAVDHTKWKMEDLRGMFLEALRRNRELSIRRGLTLAGPHRDDVRFLANGIDLTSYGSRGQARTALLTLKLAEVEWLRARGGEWPVLLLDEVFSELDVRRREDLLGDLERADQVFTTASDPQMLPAAYRSKARAWWVEGGTLQEHSL